MLLTPSKCRPIFIVPLRFSIFVRCIAKRSPEGLRVTLAGARMMDAFRVLLFSAAELVTLKKERSLFFWRHS